MNSFDLPAEIQNKLPDGYQISPGVWLVLPETKLNEMQTWIRVEDWYPTVLHRIIWFGDDGTGNFLGWDPDALHAILWNPEDGDVPWKTGAVSSLWLFIQNDYRD
ncbi:hypothetical protein [Collimonas sp.]|jgi:hypothetical protein|uniref:hypothetical protein n=1 Tax=Collimonas sp. TaxID=1963772 RepID=UPI002BA8B3B8|nr:hypothetical protein [Collimonas sp.]HWX01988.1 hypothetical protein [Collimonas sp.]